MTEPLNVAIVGYGFASRTFHAPLIAAVPGLELTAIMSSDPAKVKTDWPAVAVDATAADLFARPEIDLVGILNALAAMLASFAAVPRSTRRTMFKPLPKRQGPKDKRHTNGSADKGSGGNGAKVQTGRYCPAML